MQAQRLETEPWLPYQGHIVVPQRKALADTTELTDTVYFGHPTGSQTPNPWVSKQKHCIFELR